MLVVVITGSVLLLIRTYHRQRAEMAIPEAVTARMSSGTAEGFAKVGTGMKDFFIWLFNWRGLIAEKQEDAMQIAQLTAQNDLLEQQAKEYGTLLKTVEYQSGLPMRTVCARIIAREPGSWLREFTVNVGTKDGVEKDMVVIAQKGLVGRILRAEETSSVVLTIVDPQSSVAIALERSGDDGIMKGTTDSGAESPLCHLEYLPFDVDIAPGDRVLTSGLGGIYPKGLTVGTVTEASVAVKSDSYALVMPEVDFGHLDYVLILTGEGN